jgi:enoyl-CoA hydratase/carnithine racemase
VVTITLNRPQALNAINPQMTAELHQALDAADADPEARAIILTGAGRAFSAGYDIGRRPTASRRWTRPASRSRSSSRGGGRATAILPGGSCTSGISRSR